MHVPIIALYDFYGAVHQIFAAGVTDELAIFALNE